MASRWKDEVVVGRLHITEVPDAANQRAGGEVCMQDLTGPERRLRFDHVPSHPDGYASQASGPSRIVRISWGKRDETTYTLTQVHTDLKII